MKPKEQTKGITYDDDDESLEQKQESYNKLSDEKLDEIQELSREIDYKKINFIKFKGPFNLFKKIRDGDVSLEMAEEDQEKFKQEFSQIKSGNSNHKSEMQLYTIKNVKNLYDSRQKIILIYLIITQKLNLNLFIDQNMVKLREKYLKYYQLNK